MDENGQNPKVIMRGHFSDTLSGLTTHPKLPEVVTCGEDCLLSVWNIETKKQIIKKTRKLDFSAEALDISRDDGDYLAVGCSNGHVQIYDYNNMSLLHHIKDRT